MSRIYADVPETTHTQFYVAARKSKFRNGKTALVKLIQGFISEVEGSELPEDPHAELLEKAREMLEKGGRAAQSMEDAILGSYAIHRDS